METQSNKIELTKQTLNSLTLKKDARGNYNWEIKLYFENDWQETINEIKDIDNKLREIYTGDKE